MKSITIHGLDQQMDQLIKEKAKREGLSLNKMIKKLIAKALGIDANKTDEKYASDFKDFFGSLSKQEASQLLKRTKADRKIDKKDWQ